MNVPDHQVTGRITDFAEVVVPALIDRDAKGPNPGALGLDQRHHGIVQCVILGGPIFTVVHVLRVAVTQQDQQAVV